MSQIPILTISEDEAERLTKLAQQRGYDAPDAYLRALVSADAEQHAIELPFSEDVRASFKRAFRDALLGNVMTEEEFWKRLAEEL